MHNLLSERAYTICGTGSLAYKAWRSYTILREHSSGHVYTHPRVWLIYSTLASSLGPLSFQCYRERSEEGLEMKLYGPGKGAVCRTYNSWLLTYTSSGHSVGFSSRPPEERNFKTSWLLMPGYGARPRENTSQQVTPYDHYGREIEKTERCTLCTHCGSYPSLKK